MRAFRFFATQLWAAPAFLPIVVTCAHTICVTLLVCLVQLRSSRALFTDLVFICSRGQHAGDQELVEKKVGAGQGFAQAVGLFHYTFLHSNNVFGAFTSGALLHLIAHR